MEICVLCPIYSCSRPCLLFSSSSSSVYNSLVIFHTVRSESEMSMKVFVAFCTMSRRDHIALRNWSSFLLNTFKSDFSEARRNSIRSNVDHVSSQQTFNTMSRVHEHGNRYNCSSLFSNSLPPQLPARLSTFNSVCSMHANVVIPNSIIRRA